MSDLPWPWTPLQRHIDSSFAALQKHEDDRFAALQQQLKELKTMSQTNQDKVDAANAATAAALDAIQTDITAIAAELQAAIPQPGQVPSDASLAAMQAGVDRLNAVKTALDALAAPPAP
jgi:hypothetical protein